MKRRRWFAVGVFWVIAVSVCANPSRFPIIRRGSDGSLKVVGYSQPDPSVRLIIRADWAARKFLGLSALVTGKKIANVAVHWFSEKGKISPEITYTKKNGFASVNYIPPINKRDHIQLWAVVDGRKVTAGGGINFRAFRRF